MSEGLWPMKSLCLELLILVCAIIQFVLSASLSVKRYNFMSTWLPFSISCTALVAAITRGT